jgi:hypothetical protein
MFSKKEITKGLFGYYIIMTNLEILLLQNGLSTYRNAVFILDRLLKQQVIVQQESNSVCIHSLSGFLQNNVLCKHAIGSQHGAFDFSACKEYGCNAYGKGNKAYQSFKGSTLVCDAATTKTYINKNWGVDLDKLSAVSVDLKKAIGEPAIGSLQSIINDPAQMEELRSMCKNNTMSDDWTCTEEAFSFVAEMLTPKTADIFEDLCHGC